MSTQEALRAVAMLVALVHCLIAAFCMTSCVATFSLVKLNSTYAESAGARCLDGSPASYYIDRVSGVNATKWVFNLQGGGYCINQADCIDRANSSLGSSKSLPPGYSRPTGIMALTSSANPDFVTWNKVFINYCSGDFWTGTRIDNSSQTWGLFFSGHNIVKAVLADIDSQYGLSESTNIIWLGTSAGGVGAIMNVDAVQERYPSARVTLAPNAGIFTAETQYSGGGVDVNVRQLQSVWEPHVPPACAATVASNDISACILGNYSPDLATDDSFWTQAILDTVLLQQHLGFTPTAYSNTATGQPWLKSTYESRLARFNSWMFSRPARGYWISSALLHVITEADDCTSSGANWFQVFSNWYFNREGTLQRSFDGCGSQETINYIASGSTSTSASCNACKTCSGSPISFAPVQAQSPMAVRQPNAIQAPVKAPVVSPPVSSAPTAASSPPATVTSPANVAAPSARVSDSPSLGQPFAVIFMLAACIMAI